jgi:nitrite reductase/ring-hydroxylating ferredoxin subunit
VPPALLWDEIPTARDGKPLPGSRLCALADLPDSGTLGVKFFPESAAFHAFLVRQDDRKHAYMNKCPHAGVGWFLKKSIVFPK